MRLYSVVVGGVGVGGGLLTTEVEAAFFVDVALVPLVID